MLKNNLPPLPPAVTEALATAQAALSPVASAALRAVRRIATAGSSVTIGAQFRHLCIVGLNKAELLYAGEKESIFGEHWQDLTDESMRRHLALIFFAPRGYDGQPVNPYLFLAGEQLETAPDALDPNALQLAEQLIGNLPLLDFCRMPPAQPNTVNVMVAADTLFHWDIKDNYVLPTSPTSWVRDCEQVLKGYPRTTQAHIYTQWETDLLAPSDRIHVHSLRELPLDGPTWINRPTVQEAYGNHVLLGGIILAALVGGLLYTHQRSLDQLNEELRVVEQQIPRDGRTGELERGVREQEQMMQKRELFYLSTKDVARALQTSRFKAANFEIRVPDVQAVPKQLLVTVEAQRDAYKGWLQEEPIAKQFLSNTATLAGVRKQPATTFKVDGLINLQDIWPAYRQLADSVAGNKPSKSPATKVTESIP